MSWRYVLSQVLRASILAWAGIGVFVLVAVTIGRRQAGWAFGTGVLIAMTVALTGGLLSVAFRVPPAVTHAFDLLLGREPSDGRTSEEYESREESEHPSGLTPLGVALIVVAEMAAALATSGL